MMPFTQLRTLATVHQDPVLDKEPTSFSEPSMEYTRPFTDLKNLHPSTLLAIESTFGHEYMSKVQSSVLSTLPTTRDLLVKAKTGTGKTLAFLVAALESLMALPEGVESIRMRGKIGCVIIAPTRELALQISEEAERLLGPLGWGVQHLVGGHSKGNQLDRISKEPAEFIVATPGRMKDLLGNSEFAAKIKESKILVLDEADTILQLGFRKELDTILETMPKDRQTFLFSATVDSKMDSLLEVALHKRSKERQGPIIIDTVGSKDINLNLATRQGYCFAPYQSHVALVRRIINDHLLDDMDFVHEQSLKKPKSSLPIGGPGQPKLPPPPAPINTHKNKIMVFLPTTRGAQLYAKVFAKLSMGKELSVFEIHSAKGRGDRKSKKGKKAGGAGNDYDDDEQGKGVLILGELDEGFIEHQLKPSPLFSVVKREELYSDWESVVLGESLDRGFKKALSKVDEKLAKSAYTAFLGYNLTVGPKIGSTDRRRILESADEYIAAFGVEERPAVSTSFLERMGFMKHRLPALEDGQEPMIRREHEYELVDGTFPTVNTRITKSHLGNASSLGEFDDEIEGSGLDQKEAGESRMSRKKRQEEFEERIGLPETEYIKINEAEWEDFIEFKPGMPKLIEKLHSPKRMGHFGNRPSKKTSKIFSNNDGW
ncbi:hypothetical protein BGX33_000869 [Mortierella sp. NVP41]|nr:hypothetical protein BGX33_000869 [Mortierella sp. NVP41]